VRTDKSNLLGSGVDRSWTDEGVTGEVRRSKIEVVLDLSSLSLILVAVIKMWAEPVVELSTQTSTAIASVSPETTSAIVVMVPT
jgi:hypothetical protein